MTRRSSSPAWRYHSLPSRSFPEASAAKIPPGRTGRTWSPTQGRSGERPVRIPVTASSRSSPGSSGQRPSGPGKGRFAVSEMEQKMIGLIPAEHRNPGQALHRAGRNFHDHVAFGHQPAEDVHAALALQVQRDALLSPFRFRWIREMSSGLLPTNPIPRGRQRSADTRRVP